MGMQRYPLYPSKHRHAPVCLSHSPRPEHSCSAAAAVGACVTVVECARRQRNSCTPSCTALRSKETTRPYGSFMASRSPVPAGCSGASGMLCATNCPSDGAVTS